VDEFACKFRHLECNRISLEETAKCSPTVSHSRDPSGHCGVSGQRKVMVSPGQGRPAELRKESAGSIL